MVTKEQIRAARAYLNWDRERLSQESGVSVPQIASFETGKVENPRTSTLTALVDAFRHQHIVFENGGVFRRQDFTTVIEGEGWYLKLLDDVYRTLIDRKNAEVLVFFSDDRVSPPEVNAMLRKIRNAGIQMRQLVEDGNTYLMGPVKEYRYIPRERFKNYVSLVYGDKVAVCAENNTKAIVFSDATLAAKERYIFEILWDNLKKPEKSDAEERF